MRGEGSQDVVRMLSGMLAARHRVEFEFYSLTNRTEAFINV